MSGGKESVVLKSKGFALMMTLWVLVLLTVLAMSFSFSTRRGSASTRNFKQDTQAHYLAVSAYEKVIAYLMADKDLRVDFIDSEGNFHTDTEREPIAGKRTVDGAELDIRITDEESRLNINFLNNPVLIRLFEHTGVPDDSIQEIVDSLADWKDPDNLHHLSGAEDEYYGALGYSAKDRPLDVPEELLLIKGFTPDYLYGSEDITPLYPLITTWSDGININTVSEELLKVLGFTDMEIDAIITHRQDRGLRKVPSRLGGFGRTASHTFRVEVAVRMQNSPQTLIITSVLSRTVGAEGPEFKTRYWKEEVIDSSRT